MTTRTFHFNGHTLPDPGAQYSNEQVRQHLAAEYFPALGQCDIEVGEEKDGQVDIHFVKRVTTKGAVNYLSTLQQLPCPPPVNPLARLASKLG